MRETNSNYQRTTIQNTAVTQKALSGNYHTYYFQVKFTCPKYSEPNKKLSLPKHVYWPRQHGRDNTHHIRRSKKPRTLRLTISLLKPEQLDLSTVSDIYFITDAFLKTTGRPWNESRQNKKTDKCLDEGSVTYSVNGASICTKERSSLLSITMAWAPSWGAEVNNWPNTTCSRQLLVEKWLEINLMKAVGQIVTRYMIWSKTNSVSNK